MRLITFERSGSSRLGALIDDDRRIVDLADATADAGTPPPWSSSMLSLIEAGADALEEAQMVVSNPRSSLPSQEVRLLAPLPRPTQVRDFLSFEQHVINSGRSAIEILASEAEDPAARRAELERSGAWGVPPIWYQMPVYYTASRMTISGPCDDIF